MTLKGSSQELKRGGFNGDYSNTMVVVSQEWSSPFHVPCFHPQNVIHLYSFAKRKLQKK